MHFFLQRETLVIVQFRLDIFFPEVIGSEGQSDAFARLEPLHRPFEPLDWSLSCVLSLMQLVVFLYFVIVCCFEGSCDLLLLVILLRFVFVGYFVLLCFCWVFLVRFVLFSVSCLFVWLCFVLFVILLFILFCFVCQFIVCCAMFCSIVPFLFCSPILFVGFLFVCFVFVSWFCFICQFFCLFVSFASCFLTFEKIFSTLNSFVFTLSQVFGCHHFNLQLLPEL